MVVSRQSDDLHGTECNNLEKKSLESFAMKKLGRVRFRIIPDASTDCLSPFVREKITLGSVIITEEWLDYGPLSEEDYEHVAKTIFRSERKVSELLHHVHLIASLIKRWLLETHQGAVSRKHLSGYLDEYVFRFNRRLSTHRGNFFYRLMQQATSTEPISRQEIIS